MGHGAGAWGIVDEWLARACANYYSGPGIERRTTVGHQSIHVTGIRYESTGIATLASGGRGLGMRF